MKELTNTTIYACEFCGKWYKRKHHCLHHETYRCYQNPNNQHKCLEGCKHLQVLEETEYWYDYSGNENEFKYKTFKCALSDEEMYTYRLTPNMKLKQFVGGKRMPIKCYFYEKIKFTEDLELFPH